MQSLYEIETTIKRVSKSQGLSWGISEEAGKAIRSLEQSNLNGLESFKRLIDYGFNNLTKLLQTDQTNTQNLCPIHFGLFFYDQSHKKEIHKTFNFNELREPLIIIPFILKAAKRNLVYFKLNSKDFSLSITPGNIFSLTKGEIPQSLSDFTLSVIPQREVNYSEKTWDELYQLSLDTFVDESEEKKLSGAGAGLTDND